MKNKFDEVHRKINETLYPFTLSHCTQGEERFEWKDEDLHLRGSLEVASPREEVVPDVAELHAQPCEGQMDAAIRNDPSRFCMYFKKESVVEIERRRYLAKTTPITPVLEVCIYYITQRLKNCN